MATSLKEEALAQLLKSRLSSDMRTCGQTIEVFVANDDIILVGICDTDEQEEVARMIALGTCGVRHVTVNIRVRRFIQAI